MGMWSSICPPQLSLGRIGSVVFYPGQPKLCNKCSSGGHFATSSPEMTCSLCQDLQHLANRNLCDKSGHAYNQCPEALHNQSTLMEEFFRLDMEEAGERRAVPGVPNISVPVVSVQSVFDGPSNVVSSPCVVPPESVSVYVVSDPLCQSPQR